MSRMKTLLMFAPVLVSSLPVLAQPLRAPAVPLIVHDPYFSIWSAADRLYEACPTHWTGKSNGLSCLIAAGESWESVPAIAKRGPKA